MQVLGQTTQSVGGHTPRGTRTKQRGDEPLSPVRIQVAPQPEALVIVWDGYEVDTCEPDEVLPIAGEILAVVCRDGRVIPTLTGIHRFRRKLDEVLEVLE